MKKILIISYFSPPCNLTAANRVGSWMQHLPEHNIHPILITRNWTGEELTEESRLADSGNEIRIEKQKNSSTYYMPYRASLRDRFYIKGKHHKVFALLSKVLTLYQLVFQNFCLYSIPYSNVYHQARALLKADSSINRVVISGNLFEQFYFGYLLKNEFPYISWIADYRDEWTSHHLYGSFNAKGSLIKYLERASELKWVASASAIQTVCPYFAKRLAALHKRKVQIVPNGYDERFAEFLESKREMSESRAPLSLLFGGTLYQNQKVDLFFRVLANFRAEQVQVDFVGAKLDVHEENTRKLIQLEILKVHNWMEKSEAITMMKATDVFLMFPFEGMKGWPSSKLYDYLPFQKPILLFPSDDDIIEEILKDTGLGLIPNDETELKAAIDVLIQKKRKGTPFLASLNRNNIQKYSRINSIDSLIKVLNL